MKHIIYSVVILLAAAAWVGCSKQGRIDHITDDASVPAQVSDVHVEEVPGGAVITYRLPQDPSLAYVKAVYETQSGMVREAKASYYTDTLRLDGFGDTLAHAVNIYSVGKNEKASEPLTISVVPLTPPVFSVFDSLDLSPTFGGVQVSFRNASQADLAIEVMLDTTGLGTWSPVTTFYTGALEGSFSARGFEATEKKFAVYVRDRWNNKSDTLIKTLTPIYEEQIPKNTWQSLHLPTDTWIPAESYVLEHLWDGVINGYAGIFASSNATTLPQWFTIDLGQKVIISRVVEHQQETSHLYAGSAVKTFELYGSNDPDPDGGWANWQLLGTFHSFKPSGLPMGSITAEDKNYGWFLGEDFAFDHLLPPVRYIRWKSLETYGSSGQVVIAELDIWGQIVP